MSGRAAQFSVDLRAEAQRRNWGTHLAMALLCFSVSRVCLCLFSVTSVPCSNQMLNPPYVRNDKEPLIQGEIELEVNHLSSPCVYSDPS